MNDNYAKILKNSSILIAEDSKLLLKQYKEIFASFCDNITLVEDGIEALKSYKQCKPTIIFTDINMPNKNGLELIEDIREIDSKTPIVIISALDDKITLIKAVKLRLVSYITKPVKYIDIENALEECIMAIDRDGTLEVKFSKNERYLYSKKSFLIDNELVELTLKESLFIELLLNSRGSVVSKNDIEFNVCSGAEMSAASLKNFISRLRKKAPQDLIKTISSIGFKIE
ncbi:MAG: response regulator [Helicobacteraceae bacterium]|nr:response regulator [Helicobacteraceae bacterium]